MFDSIQSTVNKAWADKAYRQHQAAAALWKSVHVFILFIHTCFWHMLKHLPLLSFFCFSLYCHFSSWMLDCFSNMTHETNRSLPKCFLLSHRIMGTVVANITLVVMYTVTVGECLHLECVGSVETELASLRAQGDSKQVMQLWDLTFKHPPLF